MKQSFVIEFDSPDEITEAQVGVPLMQAFSLDTVKVDKGAQPGARTVRKCPHCKTELRNDHCGTCDIQWTSYSR